MKLPIIAFFLLISIFDNLAFAESEDLTIFLEYNAIHEKHLFKAKDTYCFFHQLGEGPYLGWGYKLKSKSGDFAPKYFNFKLEEYYYAVVHKGVMDPIEYLNILFHDPLNELAQLRRLNDYVLKLRKKKYETITGSLIYYSHGGFRTYSKELSFINAPIFSVELVIKLP